MSQRPRSSATPTTSTARRSNSPRATSCAGSWTFTPRRAGGRSSRRSWSSSWSTSTPTRTIRWSRRSAARGRRETSRQAYGVDAVNEFDPLFEDVYDFCEAQGIDIDTLTHEAGAAQMEMNFNHGDAMQLADQAFLFKRTVREAGLRQKVYATFMAKPMQDEPGSSMHIHQSLLNAKTGRNLFAQKNGKNTSLFHTTSAACRSTCRR